MNIIFGIILTLFSLSSIAGSIATPKQTKTLCSNAVTLFSNGKIGQSFNALKPYWPMPAAEIDNLAYETKKQLKMVSGRFGSPIGTDFINTQKAGTSFLKHTYIIKYDKHAIRYVCLFYKPKNTWLVNSVVWDDNTASLFE